MSVVSDQVFRRLVVWCPDWPVVAATRAAGLLPSEPAAVFDANRVLACSAPARESGVRRGMRRREAQGRCPELVVHEHDPDRDARLFEPVVAAVESLAPGVEIIRPGVVAVPARGPAGYFGSEASAAERVIDRVGARTGLECQVGVADGLFAAILAARRGILVEAGSSREFLAPLGIEEIDQPAEAERAELVDLLRRLGIRRLGEFADLPPSDVATRFGPDALTAHRAARGQEERPPGRRTPPADLTVTDNPDPPVERVDAAAFVARTLAQRLHDNLAERGLACTRLGISARTGNDEELHRVWWCAEPLTPAGTADRMRWQLDGWLTGRRGEQRPTTGVTELSLWPEEVVDAGGLQLDLVRAATGEADDRAARALVRVQGMLGPDAVLTGVAAGGRDARDRIRLVPWGEASTPDTGASGPWPGRLPAPSPTVVPDSAWDVAVLDAAGSEVGLTERNRLTAEPRRVVTGGGRSRPVAAWAGPWPLDERWWLFAGDFGSARDREDPVPRGTGTTASARCIARMQVVLDADAPADGDTGTDGDTAAGDTALLLVHEDGRWWVQGVYR